MIYRVKIIKCSLPIMWYANHIGEEYDCEVVSCTDTLFSYFIYATTAYKAIHPIEIESIHKGHFKKVTLPNGGEKFIYIQESKCEKIYVGGWILDDDVEVLEIK